MFLNLNRLGFPHSRIYPLHYIKRIITRLTSGVRNHMKNTSSATVGRQMDLQQENQDMADLPTPQRKTTRNLHIHTLKMTLVFLLIDSTWRSLVTGHVRSSILSNMLILHLPPGVCLDLMHINTSRSRWCLNLGSFVCVKDFGSLIGGQLMLMHCGYKTFEGRKECQLNIQGWRGSAQHLQNTHHCWMTLV